MISLQDWVDLCGLEEDEVAAISEHEHIPEIAAAALASYLLHQPHGGETIRTMIIDDIHKALDQGRIKPVHGVAAFSYTASRRPGRVHDRVTRVALVRDDLQCCSPKEQASK